MPLFNYAYLITLMFY